VWGVLVRSGIGVSAGYPLGHRGARLINPQDEPTAEEPDHGTRRGRPGYASARNGFYAAPVGTVGLLLGEEVWRALGTPKRPRKPLKPRSRTTCSRLVAAGCAAPQELEAERGEGFDLSR
jgi:hypothetical protein